MSWIMTGAAEAVIAVHWQAGLITAALQEKLLLPVREGSVCLCVPLSSSPAPTPPHLHLVRIEST